MSTGGSASSSDRRPRNRRPVGFLATLGYYATAPIRSWNAWTQSRRARRAKQRAEGGRRPSFLAMLGLSLAVPFLWIGSAFRTLFAALGNYALSRNAIYVLQGLPAVLVFAGTVVLAVLAFVNTRSEKMVAFYKKKGEEATRKWEETPEADKQKRKALLEQAAVCYERWAMLNPTNPEPKYFNALTASRGDDPERKAMAFNLMSQLAKHDRPGGYLRAHQWLAEYFLAQMAATVGDVEKQVQFRDLAEVHLMRVLTIEPNDVEAHQRLAGLYLNLRRFDRAEQHFLRILKYDEGINLYLSEIYFNTGRIEQAMEYARKARDHFQKQLEIKPDDYKNRMRLASQLIRLKEYKEARDVLTDGMKLSPRPELKQMIGAVYLARMADLPADAFDERLQLYEEVIKFDPMNPDAFKFLVDSLTPNNPLFKQTQAKIDEMVVKDNTGLFHFILANLFLQQKKHDLAKSHLESAVRMNPNLVLAVNNLSWLLAHSERPDYERALSLLEAALTYVTEKGMENLMGNLLDTRGQVYLLMGRVQNARKDLERARDMGLRDNLETRAGLLKCYQVLNLQELAEEESRIVQVLKDAEAKKKAAAGAAAVQ